MAFVVRRRLQTMTISFPSHRERWRTPRCTGTTSGRNQTARMPWACVFAKNEAGEVFHTYSTYAPGVDMLNGTYRYIDLTPKGRDEVGHDKP